ncbi:MAG TPA: Era-like GTP-binding protein, partial [Isosphaeraceae bacterium]|nr:Era-like GTP-binding protein [Isosphaeraceae bacterium]
MAEPTADPDQGTSTPTAASAELDPLLERLDRSPISARGSDAVERARDSLEATLAGLQLTPEEEKVLAVEIGQLRELTKKLDETTIEIAAFGMVSRGKSSVLNALLGRDIFEVGATHGTTITRSAQRWEQGARGSSGLDQARLVLVDTPGIDEVGGEVRETLAREVARTADLILFIVSGDMQRREVQALSKLRSHQKPIILVFNQIDRYPETDRQQIHAKLEDERVKGLIHPEDIVLTAARPDPIRIKIQQPDGTSKIVWERPAPVIEPLKARILDVLEREGKALVALNTLLLAGDLHEEIV